MPKDEEKNEISVSDEDLDKALVDDGIEDPVDDPEDTDGDEVKDEESVIKDTVDGNPEEDTDNQDQEDEPDEPIDNADRSKLGRKVADLSTKFEDLITLLRGGQEASPQPEPQIGEEELKPPDIDPDVPLSWNELKEIQIYEDKVAQRKIDRYNSNFTQSIATLAKGETNESHDAIIKEMVANHNIKRSDDGNADAQINYLRAKTAILEKNAGIQANPLAKNDIPVEKEEPLGGGVENSDKGKEDKPIKLDPHAAAFAKRMKLSDKSIKKALSGDMPAYLGGR